MADLLRDSDGDDGLSAVEKRNTGATAEGALHVFLHIPKTAGTSFNTLLSREYGRRHLIHFPDGLLDDGAMYFNALPLEVQAELRLVRGHILHGMHASVPRSVEYFTILRDPIARILSFLNHMASEAALRPEDKSPWLEAVRHWSDAETYMQERPLQVDNYMVRAVSGVRFPPGGCDEETLSVAIRNLDAMRAFGIQERLDESLIFFRRRLSWRALPIISRSKAGNPIRISLSRRDREFLAERNRFDRRLYEHAVRRFDSTIAQEPHLHELAALSRRLTPVATHVEGAVRWLRSVVGR